MDPTAIWNRACFLPGEPVADLRLGDLRLATMLLFHGVLCNGGVTHAIECFAAAELDCVVDAYRHFGLGDVATMIERIRHGEESDMPEDVRDSIYNQLVPTDQTLEDAFELALRRDPSSFKDGLE
ncbi:MAG: hypothetical protein H6513_02475 [Acidimicrobiaceae bacterium]|nr:hypothetical protein [Acidimicrobiaceae bacterium]MCO5331127.1 hypothetical protein [Ilumatobacteraceae bacterium]